VGDKAGVMYAFSKTITHVVRRSVPFNPKNTSSPATWSLLFSMLVANPMTRSCARKYYRIIVGFAADMTQDLLHSSIQVPYLMQVMKGYCNRGIACYRLAGMLITTLATANNSWLKLLFFENEKADIVTMATTNNRYQLNAAVSESFS
jgi:hypothetical protein